MRFAEIRELYKNNSGRGKEYYKGIFLECVRILEKLEREEVESLIQKEESVIRFGMLSDGYIGLYGARGHSGTVYIYSSTIEIDMQKDTIKFALKEKTDTESNLKKIFGKSLLGYRAGEYFTVSINYFD